MSKRQQCPDCGKMVRTTGFLAGWHICLTDEEIKQKNLDEQTRFTMIHGRNRD